MQMPRIMYGTAWKKDQTARLVEKAVRYGFSGIDTACQPKHYHEAGVGEALTALQAQGLRREHIFLQTKFTPLAGQDPERVPYNPDAPLAEQVAQSFATSQKNLGTEYVDSLVLHSPLSRWDQFLSVWRAMEALHGRGAAKQLGISNCYDPVLFQRLHQEARVKPSVLQNRFYADTGYDKELRAFCRERGIVYQSFWTLTANPQILRSRVVQQLARAYRKTEAQVFFRYLTQIGIVPLTGTTSDQHMQEDLAIFDFEIAADALPHIEALLV
ncbi:MAG TPA: aldo/keto reductase [Oligoflexus sp.]|uniref:aldo/keto reductase family protein n=1 Tax=Oligoflexus sp. TaxID=1971216 RepID=UPI002D801A65|nr:aldo/keto reductase [Oligoflexus sp.]HET9237463.1 aldo/keto reductase [Oligoflexus sp.]